MIVSVNRTFFDGQSSGEKYSDFLPAEMHRIIGTVVNVYSGTRAQIRWDIDESLSVVNISELSKVAVDSVITANDFEGLAGCLEQESAAQAAESHALLDEFSLSEEIESEGEECGKKKSKKRGTLFRKKLGDLTKGDSDSDSDVEFESKSIEGKKDEGKKRKIEEQGDKKDEGKKRKVEQGAKKDDGKKDKKEVEKKGKIEQVDKEEKKKGKIGKTREKVLVGKKAADKMKKRREREVTEEAGEDENVLDYEEEDVGDDEEKERKKRGVV